MKKILFAASECVPFIKTGGLADVCGALPKEFDKRKKTCKHMNVIECACTLFYIICITNAVVCGGMLAVMNVACCIRTRKPGTSLENGTVLPAGLKITVSGVI